MTPYLQRPLELGFDVSLHSATKFLGGHSDVVAGLAVAAKQDLGQRLKGIQNSFGSILGPQDAWLTLRGMRTLGVRLEAQQKTALELACWLSARKDIARVHYPGLSGHPGRDIHFQQASGPGAVLSFELKSAETAKAFLRLAKLPMLGVSLGGVESILSYPATMSHAAMPPAERARRGVSDALVRLSVGLESPSDLREDLAQALDRAAREQ
jgi:cystathionine beta-lyase